MKKLLSITLCVVMMALSLGACASDASSENEEVTITIFAAKSLSSVLDELVEVFKQDNPNVEFQINCDSSGTLMEQIRAGAQCDIFFSAAQKQMDTLEEEGLLEDGTRINVVNNQVCVVTYKGSDTKVTGLGDISKASSLALADGSVPVGKYTRAAMVGSGLITTDKSPEDITTAEISEALGDITINECANVGAVATAVSEGVNEVGTVYYSDYKGFEDSLEIIEIIPYELTGDVIYPAACVKNMSSTRVNNTSEVQGENTGSAQVNNTSDAQVNNMNDAQVKNEAKVFLEFLKSDKAKAIFEKYYFDTDV